MQQAGPEHGNVIQAVRLYLRRHQQWPMGRHICFVVISDTSRRMRLSINLHLSSNTLSLVAALALYLFVRVDTPTLVTRFWLLSQRQPQQHHSFLL